MYGELQNRIFNNIIQIQSYIHTNIQMTNLEHKRLDQLLKNNHLQQDKKKENKKMIIKNAIINILSHQPRKLMKLAKKSAFSIKNSDNQLIPKLSLKNLYPQIDQMQKMNKQRKIQFESMNNELTTSMLFFHKNINHLSNQQQGKILSIQTAKCYKHIPQFYFRELEFNQVSKMLTRNRNQVQQTVYDLIDYSDEVEYNINQQVNYKMKVFLEFVSYLNGVGHLVDISTQKMKGARNQNRIVRQIIVQKSININLLRIKQQNLGKTIDFLMQIKKVKQIQKSLMSMILAKGKMSVCQLYETYILQHLQIKEVCCKHNLCNFSNIRYFVQRNYHQIFNKALQNYLGEIVKIQKDKIKEVFHPKKSSYISSPNANRDSFSFKNSQQNTKNEKNSSFLDQSIQVQDWFQLIIKSNIQKEILHIFSMGLQKCTYSTDLLCQFLKQELNKIQLQFFQLMYENHSKKQDLFDSFINFTLNKPTPNSLQNCLQKKYLSMPARSQICNKIPLIKFISAVQIYSKNLQNICTRTNSIINQLLKVLKPFQKQQPEKHEIIFSYLIQIVMIIVSFSSNSLSALIQSKEIKQSEIKISDKLIYVCKSWETFILQMEPKYSELWRKLSYHISMSSSNSNEITLTLQNKNSFNSLKEFVEQNFDKQNIQQEMSIDLMQKQQILFILMEKLLTSKDRIVSVNFSNFYKQVSSKELIKYIELDPWTTVNISSLTLGYINYIFYGQYMQNQKTQIDDSKFLSSSLLLDKSNLAITRKSQEKIEVCQNKFNFNSAQDRLMFGNSSFKLIKSVQFLIEVIYTLFLYFDQYKFILTSNKNCDQAPVNNYSPKTVSDLNTVTAQLLLNKTSELFILFSNQVKNLMSNLNNLKNKVKSFAKFFVLLFSQVELLKTLAGLIFSNQERILKNCINSNLNCKQLQNTRQQIQSNLQNLMNEISKKYNQSTVMKIRQSIKKFELNLKKPITYPSAVTKQIIQIFSKSVALLQQHLISKNEYDLFLGCSWAKIYIQKLNQQQNIIQKSIMKSTGSNNGLAGKMQEIDWQQKNNWMKKQLEYLQMQIQAQSYFKHVRDINLIKMELQSSKHKKNKS